ncbi:MAG: hypothetical protein GC193_03605 [Cryomorphaceae bacterium]|nr:hypothetical protein [Cryomorphaceae bacterium]
MSTLIIDPKNELIMRNHALKDFPNECCGFFFGSGNEERVVTHVTPVKNSKDGDQRRRFQISPTDYMKAERYALEHDLTLLGIYHSHPLHPAIPSEHDRLAAMPWFSYVILSVNAEYVVDVNSWQLNDAHQFERETVLTGTSQEIRRI